MTDAPALPPGRVYTNPGIVGHPTLSTVVVVVAGFYGVFELVRAWQQNFQSQMDILFGVFFVGGGIYGFNKTWTDNRDTVLTLDVDDATRQADLALWRPFQPKKIATSLDALTGWRYLVKLGQRGEKTHLITAECPGYPRRVRFEIHRGKPFPEGLRKVAPEAVADDEESTGTRPAA